MKKTMANDDAEYDLIHWEAVIRTIIERIGVDQVREIIAYVVEQKRDDARKLDAFRREFIKASPEAV